MTLDDAVEDYVDGERKRLLKEMARFAGNVDATVDRLEKQIQDIYSAQAELYDLAEAHAIDERAMSTVLERMAKLGVKPPMNVADQRYY